MTKEKIIAQKYPQCATCHYGSTGGTMACDSCVDAHFFIKKYTCRDCEYCFEAHVCNCLNAWKEPLFNRSTVNDSHGQIGWVCTLVYHIDDVRHFDVMKTAESYCEMFKRRKDI